MKLIRVLSLQGLLFTIALGWASIPAIAGEVDVIDVTIESLGGGNFRINATLEHEDTGWDHYADRWDVIDESGNVLGSRELAHPHVNEQPFTRSLRLSIPATVKNVIIQANDSVHETGGKSFSLAVPHPE